MKYFYIQANPRSQADRYESLSATNPKDRSYRVVGKISKTIGRVFKDE